MEGVPSTIFKLYRDGHSLNARRRSVVVALISSWWVFFSFERKYSYK